jgi:glycosyltransferase involved in cell wall biosynthesis
MKLVIATPLYPPEIGGPATYAQFLFAALPKEGIEVELVKFSEVRHLPKIIRHYAYYRRILRVAYNADVILALDPVSVGWPVMRAAQKARKPFVLKVVGDYAWEQGTQRFGVIQSLDEFVQTAKVPPRVRVLRRVQTRVAASAARVIVPSAYLKKIVAAWGIPSEKIEVIYNGIELPEIQALKARPSGFLVVSSGRPVPWKGFEALKRVVAHEPAWHLFIASGLSRTETLGWVKSADVFVLNSSYEGLSHALIEAMTLGTPVIATDAGGNAELVENGVTGLLVPLGNESALLAALKDIEQNRVAARSRAVNAQTRMKKFSTETMLRETATLLKKI